MPFFLFVNCFQIGTVSPFKNERVGLSLELHWWMNRLWIILRNIGLHVTMQWHVLVKLDVQTSIIEFSQNGNDWPPDYYPEIASVSRTYLSNNLTETQSYQKTKKLILPSEKRISPKQVKTFLGTV